MSEDSSSLDGTDSVERPRRRRWPWVIVAVALGLGVLYGRGWTTQPLILADGRRFEVLNFDRHLSILVHPDGSRSSERMLWVRYWSEGTDRASMQAEARSIAPALYPLAERLGYSTVKMDPSRPVLVRRFPLALTSVMVRFDRDSSGAWRETSQ